MSREFSSTAKFGTPVIKCPYCGCEYLPAEIFYPSDLTGTPKSVIKDALGKVLYVEWKKDEEPVYVQTFVCDSCNEAFKVEAVVSYKVEKEAEELNFEKQSVSLL